MVIPVNINKNKENSCVREETETENESEGELEKSFWPRRNVSWEFSRVTLTLLPRDRYNKKRVK